MAKSTIERADESFRINQPVREPIELKPLELAHLACEYARATGEQPDPMKAIRFWQQCQYALVEDTERDYLRRKEDADRFPLVGVAKICKELGVKDARNERASAIFRRFLSWYRLWWLHTQVGRGSPENALEQMDKYPEEREEHERYVDGEFAKLGDPERGGVSRHDFYRWVRLFPDWRASDVAMTKSVAAKRTRAGAKMGETAKKAARKKKIK